MTMRRRAAVAVLIMRVTLGLSAVGRRFCHGTASFFPQQPPVTAECVVEEGAKSVLVGLERAACHAPLTQLQEIAPHWVFGKLIGRAPVLRR